MKRNALTYLLLPFLLALLVTACKDDTLPASPAEEEEAGSGVYVSVVVNTGGSNASRVPTPGEDGDGSQAGTVEESSVYDLNVFFFQGEVDENTGKRLGINSLNAESIPVHSLYFSSEDLHSMGPDASNNYDAVYSVTKEVSEIGLLVGQTYDVLVIANIDYDPIKSPFEINNLSDLQKANFYDVMVHIENEKKFAMASAGPDFDAEKGINSVTIEASNTENNPAVVNVDIERLVARVDCHINENGIYEVADSPEDKVELKEFIVVNKYYVVNPNDESFPICSYWFKRVTKDTDLSGGNIKMNYLGNELPLDGKSPAANYVIAPMTLDPPEIVDREGDRHPYDHSFYFNKNKPDELGDWISREQLNHAITSTHKGLEYHFLDYVQENILPADMLEEQKNREYYCTGIVFKAKYIPDGKASTDTYDVYRYKGECYTNTNLPAGVTENTPGVTKYSGGICYYTYWIKHADDGDDTKVSPMEYAIVRNNIYQINVTGVSGIGTVTPTDYGLYLTCTVVDWVEENAIDIDFTESTAYKGDFVGVSVKKDENAVLVAYSQDNEFRDAQFTFRMQTPRGATWTAHLSNPDDFELVGDYIGVGTGTDSSNEGLVTLTVRARRPFEEGSERTTALYITTNVFDNPIAFNQGSGESTLFPGENTYIRIRQVSTTDYDNTQEITDDNQGN